MVKAPVSKRVVAGVIDALAIFALSAFYFVAPMLLRGLVLPMWGVLLAMVGYGVVPLAFLKKTVGMKLMGIELARRDGHAVDLANVLVRELLGRGYFPAAFILTVLAGLVAQWLGVASFLMPTGVALSIFLTSGVALVLAGLGHLLVFNREDGRSLADLVARSYVVLAPARKLPDDPDELAAWRLEHRARVRNIAAFQVLLVALAFAVPWGLSARGGETTSQQVARLKRQALQAKFDADPANRPLAEELQDALLSAGREEEAKAVAQKHRAALLKRDAEREVELRQRLQETPGEEHASSALIELLEGQNRIDEATAVYLAWLGPTPTPGRRGGFANWLASVGREPDAEAQLRLALAADPLLPMGQTMFGLVLKRLGKGREAEEALFLALLDDPEDEDARDGMEELQRELGPVSDIRRVALTAQFRAWTADAGR